jgi:hypothetical protein
VGKAGGWRPQFDGLTLVSRLSGNIVESHCSNGGPTES